MSDIFITSDEHYGHENIIKYVNRPFTSVEEQTETLIERHNKKVPNKRSYLTIHAGDLFWETMNDTDALQILSRLHGRHQLLWGNHDYVVERSPRLRELLTPQHAKQVRFNGKKLSIYHYAQRVWEGSHKGHWHVFGHSHQELPPFGKSFDIGVEGHNYEPWSLEEIEQKMNTLPQEHRIVNVWKGKEKLPCPTCGTEFSCLDCLRLERGHDFIPPRGDLEGYKL